MFENIDEIICLGQGGSNSEIALDKFYEHYRVSAYKRSFPTITECIQYVDRNPNSIGVIPIENNVEGIIPETCEGLISPQNTNVKILAQTIIPVNNCLLSKTTEFYSISGLIAHPKAIAHCQSFVKNELPRNVNIILAEDMAEAAAQLNRYNLTYAIIGTPKTAEIYNLNILKRDIDNNPNLSMRCIIIGNCETEITGKDVTSIVLFLNDRKGALLDMVKVFVNHDINITHINSKMRKGTDNQQAVFIDFEGHIKEEKIQQVLEELKPYANEIRFSGSYASF